MAYNIENIAVLIKKDFSIVVFVENDATEEDITNIREKHSTRFPISKVILAEGITEETTSAFAEFVSENVPTQGKNKLQKVGKIHQKCFLQ